jgi:hypothetical protein
MIAEKREKRGDGGSSGVTALWGTGLSLNLASLFNLSSIVALVFFLSTGYL